MTYTTIVRALFASALPLLLHAQPAGKLSMPNLGYILEAETGRVMRIDGIAGSALARSEAGYQTALVELTVPGSGRYAAALDAASRQLLLRKEGEAEFLPLPSGNGSPIKAFALSASGERLALTDGHTLQVWSGIPDEPHLDSTTPLSFQEDVAGLVISDRGSVALLRKSSGALVNGDGAALVDGPVSAMSFRPGSSAELVAIRGEEKSLWRVGVGEPARLADGVTGIDAAQWAGNGRIYAVSAAEKAVLEIDAKSGALLQRLECAFVPTMLEPLSGEASFRLTPHKAGEPLWMVDANSGETRVLFIPVLVPEKGGEE